MVAQAATRYTDVPFTSFCEGTYDFPQELADAAGLDRERIRARMVGLNHTTWSISSDWVAVVRRATCPVLTIRSG